jgi:hypothetical protein
LRVVELCAGLGGMRAGLEAEGWETVLALDSSSDAVVAHRATFGDAVEADVWDFQPEDLPAFDVLSAGFPCQPFSSSGHRSGFRHQSGNVFEGIVRILDQRRPPTLLLENVYGLLHNKAGHTFARVLQELTGLGYAVDWLTVDLRWFGYPQTRPRVLILAVLDPKFPNIPDTIKAIGTSAFNPVIARLRLSLERIRTGSLAQIEESRRPAVGKPAHRGNMPFGAGGMARGDEFVSFRVKAGHYSNLVASLGEIVAPGFSHPEEIRSARYWAYDGPSSLHLREEPISHCVGTSLGGAPLYAIPERLACLAINEKAFLRFSNWSRVDARFRVMRLEPARATRLFGDHTSALEQGVKGVRLGATKKYVLVGNMMAPVMAQLMARLTEGRPVDSLLPDGPMLSTATLF